MKNISIFTLRKRIELLDGNKRVMMLFKYGPSIWIRVKKSLQQLLRTLEINFLTFLWLIMVRSSLRMSISQIWPS